MKRKVWLYIGIGVIICNSMTPEMYAIIRNLPDFSGMSYEEINFYTTLVQSGKPYQKYPYK